MTPLELKKSNIPTSYSLETEQPNNLLPKDGTVVYFSQLLITRQADYYFERLMNSISWQNDEVVIFGKKIVTKRKVAWYGEKSFAYTYSKTMKHALPWTVELMELKTIIGKLTNETFNSCLLNLYHNGSEGMGWHSDNEKQLKKEGAIASLSLGAERRFILKHELTGEKVEILLENGSLLLMAGQTQKHWVHQLPLAKKIITPRINLTFRTINDN